MTELGAQALKRQIPKIHDAGRPEKPRYGPNEFSTLLRFQQDGFYSNWHSSVIDGVAGASQIAVARVDCRNRVLGRAAVAVAAGLRCIPRDRSLRTARLGQGTGPCSAG